MSNGEFVTLHEKLGKVRKERTRGKCNSVEEAINDIRLSERHFPLPTLNLYTYRNNPNFVTVSNRGVEKIEGSGTTVSRQPIQ